MKLPLPVDQFIRHQPRLVISQGLPVISAGIATDQAYYLMSGKAKDISASRAKKAFDAGDMISFVAFLALDSYATDVIAKTRCEVLAIPRHVIEDQWGSEDIASWVFACSMASDVVKKQNPTKVDYVK
tara:strand:- start:19 stop:402 length:384 start_codon:yes stop_codon:yes gene_type:complete